MSPFELARAILGLTAPQLAELNEILRREGGEPVGVREPLEPHPPEDTASAEAWPTPANLPEDYWETAQ